MEQPCESYNCTVRTAGVEKWKPCRVQRVELPSPHHYQPLASYLTDGRQFGQQHLEDRWRQGLLQHLQELLRLSTNSNSVRQVVHTLLVVTCKKGSHLTFSEVHIKL